MNNKPTIYRKLKVCNDFMPLEVKDEDELFVNGIFIFNISNLLEFIESNRSKFKRKNISVKDIPAYFQNLDETYLDKVDINRPVIFGEIAPGRFNLIDGHHRVEKARRVGADIIKGYKVTIDYLQPFFISEEAYRMHIDYWNSKLEPSEM